ncbi:hypothetical protein M758_UG325000 [Ceratodon purpureus]|nr:hypothetical protein M758_UG325000 [Ceratodon purpureus]
MTGGNGRRRSSSAAPLPVQTPNGLEELSPWFIAVERARGRTSSIPPFRYLARLMEPGAEWRWTIACSIELVEIKHASGIDFPVPNGEDTSGAVSNLEESQGSCSLQESQGSWSPPPQSRGGRRTHR